MLEENKDIESITRSLYNERRHELGFDLVFEFLMPPWEKLSEADKQSCRVQVAQQLGLKC